MHYYFKRKNKKSKKALKCLTHEYRHFYQLVVIGDETSTHPLKQTWKESLEQYKETTSLSPEELEEFYLTNPLELDAFAYTKYFFQKHLNQDLLCFALEIEDIFNLYIAKYINNGL